MSRCSRRRHPEAEEPLAADPLLPSIEIPYLCGDLPECCCAEHFLSWPETLQWQWTDDLPFKIFAARLQSWLFFGLLTCYCPTYSRLDILADSSNGYKIMDWAAVESMLRDIASRLNGDRLIINRKFLVRAHLFFDEQIDYIIASDDGLTDLWTSGLHATVLATHVLLDRLIEVSGSLSFSENGEYSTLSYAHVGKGSILSKLPSLRASSRRLGLCPSLDFRLRLSSNGWWQLLSSKRSRNFNNKHLSCGTRECLAFNIDPSSYEIQHRDDCIECDYVSLDRAILEEAISEGKIPLICCWEDKNNRIHFDIVKDNLQHSFTAISHVWAGGLGNPTTNAIPSCQLKYLKSVIDQLPEPSISFNPWKSSGQPFPTFIFRRIRNGISPSKYTYMWLDTLCIPVGGRLSYRQEAIDSMGQIYAAASEVLVLDPELQQMDQCSSLEQSPDLLDMAIATSPWMSRSWPLQESAVASRVYIKFSNSYVFLETKQRALLGLPILGLQEHGNLATRNHEQLRQRKNRRFLEIWNALSCRTTAQTSDVHAIFVTLLDRSAGEILSFPYEDRMKAIIASLDQVPLALLLCNHVLEKRTTTTIPWLPAFPNLQTGLNFLSHAEGTLEIINSGFKVKSDRPQLLIFKSIDFSKPLLLVQLGTNSRYWMYPRVPSTRSTIEGPSVFLMTKQRQYDSDLYLGVQLKVLKMPRDTQDNTYLTSFEDTFTWHLEKDSSTTERAIQCTEMAGSSLVILEDVHQWPQLNWRRDDEFPFLTFQHTNMVVYASSGALAMTALIIPVGFRLLSTTDANRVLLFVSISILCYPCLLISEGKFFQARTYVFAQRCWAASFKDNDTSRRILERNRLSTWTSLQTYFPVLTMTLALSLISWQAGYHTFLIFFVTWSIFPILRLAIEVSLRRFVSEMRLFRIWMRAQVDILYFALGLFGAGLTLVLLSRFINVRFAHHLALGLGIYLALVGTFLTVCWPFMLVPTFAPAQAKSPASFWFWYTYRLRDRQVASLL